MSDGVNDVTSIWDRPEAQGAVRAVLRGLIPHSAPEDITDRECETCSTPTPWYEMHEYWSASLIGHHDPPWYFCDECWVQFCRECVKAAEEEAADAMQ